MPTHVARPLRLSAAMTAAAAALLAGCGSSSGTTGSTGAAPAGTPVASASEATPQPPVASATPSEITPADGLVHVVDTTNGYSLALPAGWVVVPDESRNEPLGITGPVGRTVKPELATQAKGAYASGAKLIAVEPAATKFATNINIVLQPSGDLPAADIMKVVPSAKKELETLHATKFVAKPTTLGGQPAAQIDYAYVLPTTKVPVSARLIYAIRDGNAYVVTISRATSTSASSTEAIASSIRLGS